MIWLYDIGYCFFFIGKRLRRRFPVLEKPVRTYEYYFTLWTNRKLPAMYEKHPVRWGLNTKERDERYTVSLTSFPARIGYVHIAIETLMRQNFKPDHIVLWLADSQFPDRKLPPQLEELQKRGLTVRYCDDLRSHKKYFYAFQEYPEDNIILVDDDAFFARDTISKLVRMHKKYSKDIISTAAQPIAPSITQPPSVWPRAKLNRKYYHTYAMQAFSGQGTLYPAHWYPREIFNKEKAMALAGSADDMWLQAMSYLNGVKTTMLHPMRGFPIQIEIENNQVLYNMNNSDGGNRNDRIWMSLVKEYGLDRLGIDEDCRAIL